MILYYLLTYPFAFLLIPPVLIWMYFEMRTDRQWRIALMGTIALAMGTAALLIIGGLTDTAKDDWAAGRLAQAVSWVRGYRLYYPQGQGPLLTRMYGPVVSMLYTPAAIAWRPTAAMLIGGAISLLLFGVSTTWFFLRCQRGQNRNVAIAALAITCIAAARLATLQTLLRSVNTDAPGIFFGVCACAVLVGIKEAPGTPWKIGAVCGIFAALSIWSKQTFCPLIGALMVWALLIGGVRWSARFSAALLGVVVIFSTVMILGFGPRELWFNMVVLPSKRPFKWPELSLPRTFLHSLWFMRLDWWPLEWLLVGATSLRLLQDRPGRSSGGVGAWSRRNPWLLPLLVAIVLLPGGIYSYSQVGGRFNTSWQPGFFLLLTIPTALMSGWGLTRPADTPTAPPRQSMERVVRVALVACVAACTFAWPRYFTRIPSSLAALKNLDDNNNENAYRFALAHPQQVFFPRHPLATLLSEGKAYHWEDMLLCLQLAEVPLSPEQCTSVGVPSQLQMVLFPALPRPPDGSFERWLTGFDFSRPQDVPGMPGWCMFVRESR